MYAHWAYVYSSQREEARDFSVFVAGLFALVSILLFFFKMPIVERYSIASNSKQTSSILSLCVRVTVCYSVYQ